MTPGWNISTVSGNSTSTFPSREGCSDWWNQWNGWSSVQPGLPLSLFLKTSEVDRCPIQFILDCGRRKYFCDESFDLTWTYMHAYKPFFFDKNLLIVEGMSWMNYEETLQYLNRPSNVAFQDYFLPNTITSIHSNEFKLRLHFPILVPEHTYEPF